MGLHTNEDVEERRGSHLPIMDVHERCLSLLACKYVDEVIIGELQTCLLRKPGGPCLLAVSAAFKLQGAARSRKAMLVPAGLQGCEQGCHRRVGAAQTNRAGIYGCHACCLSLLTCNHMDEVICGALGPA